MSNKSKSKIIDALFALMNDKAYNDITISEISEQAQLVRKTFYNNFSSKDELVLYSCRTLLYKYFDRIENLNEFSLNKLSKNFFIFCNDHKNYIILLMKNNLFHIFIDEFYKMFKNIYENPNYDVVDITQKQKRYILSFHMAGVMKMIQLWADDDFSNSTDEMNDIYLTVVNDVQIVSVKK